MGSDAELILVAGGLLGAGIAGALLASRVRVPALLLFLGLGMLAGSEGIGGIEFDNAELARTLGTIALVLILFEGGLAAGWREIRPVLGSAASLAIIGTILTAVATGLAAMWIFDFGALESMMVGAAVATTDSAAIFAVLRHSTLQKRLARVLEGESGMNDPIGLLLMIGFIEWLQTPGYGAVDMVAEMTLKMAIGIAMGLALGWLAVRALRRMNLPADGIYPVATLAVAALAYGISELVGGSGLISVYLAGLAVGTAPLPARRTIVAFHQGIGWVAQISLFILLGLLLFPSTLGDVAIESLLLCAILILAARPLATFVSTIFSGFSLRERGMLSWAGLRGATPIWLATFPVTAGIGAADQFFSIVFFVVVSSTLIQGATFEPLARRLGLTTDEPALPQRLFESGRIKLLGGDVIAYRIEPGAAAAGHLVRELGLPREALLNVIVRDGRALPPRGSTEIREGDELHVLVRSDVREEVEELTARWHTGPIGEPVPALLPRRAASQVFSVGPVVCDGDPSAPTRVGEIAVVSVLRSRRDRASALVALADGRYAMTTETVTAIGGRQALARWCERRADRVGRDEPAERAWWQEAIGALIARG